MEKINTSLKKIPFYAKTTRVTKYYELGRRTETKCLEFFKIEDLFEGKKGRENLPLLDLSKFNAWKNKQRTRPEYRRPYDRFPPKITC